MAEFLRELPLRIGYRSDTGSIIDDFYVPCLSVSKQYRRAVGYFTSGGLSVAARGIAQFIRGDGRMYLVASPFFSPEDIEVIRRGYAARGDIITKALIRQLDLVSSSVEEDRLGCLAWLIAEKRLEIKIAIPSASKDSGGIYHEKVGVFTDATGESVAFIGSPNETVGGLVSNFESMDVFCSWDDPHGRVPIKIEQFEHLWRNETKHLEVIPFPEAARQSLLRFRPTQKPSRDPEEEEAVPRTITIPFPEPRLYIPDGLVLRDYQLHAVEAFCGKGYRGFFEMATGTGKTVAALAGLVEYSKIHRGFAVAILCPFSHLVEQWAKEAIRFGFRPVVCHSDAPGWEDVLANQLTELNLESRKFVCAIATHASGSLERFRKLFSTVNAPRILLADEVHHLGAAKLREALEDFYEARLGLSATPTRWFDEEGTRFLLDYFGDKLIEVTLADAIRLGYLVKYYYKPHIVELDDDEYESYLIITQRIAHLLSAGKTAEDDELLAKHLRDRANILNQARQKLVALQGLLESKYELRHALFYCAPHQIDDVVSLLGSKLGLIVSKFTVEESLAEREQLLSGFEQGTYQGLVAIRCLDEGVDVPPTRSAYILASSGNPREFIQRRGRILRRADGKDSAEIHDFITVPPIHLLDVHESITQTEQSLLRRELRRFREFADDAENRFEATNVIWTIAQRLHILDF